MAEIIFVGQSSKPKITFTKRLEISGNNAKILNNGSVNLTPDNWDFVEVICERYNDEKESVFFAYDKNERNFGCLYIGTIEY